MNIPSDQPDDAEAAAEYAIIERHVKALMEHFTSVQVIVTQHEPEKGTTSFLDLGNGDIYARLGAVRTWLIRQEQFAREAAKRDCRGSRAGDEDEDDACD